MTPEAFLNLLKASSVMSVVFGVIGMALCVPWLLFIGPAEYMQAAAQVFITGAILVGAGLISTSTLVSKVQVKK